MSTLLFRAQLGVGDVVYLYKDPKRGLMHRFCVHKSTEQPADAMEAALRQVLPPRYSMQVLQACRVSLPVLQIAACHPHQTHLLCLLGVGPWPTSDTVRSYHRTVMQCMGFTAGLPARKSLSCCVPGASEREHLGLRLGLTSVHMPGTLSACYATEQVRMGCAQPVALPY